MARLTCALLCAALASCASAAVIADDAGFRANAGGALQQVPNMNVPEGWLITGRASGDAELEMVVVVKRENLQTLERELYAVSDPASPRYGKHLSKAQVDAITKPVSRHAPLPHAEANKPLPKPYLLLLQALPTSYRQHVCST